MIARAQACYVCVCTYKHEYNILRITSPLLSRAKNKK